MILLELKKITEKPSSGVWFRHQSPDKMSVLKPQSYERLKSIRGDDYPLKDRIDYEQQYHKLIKGDSKCSFLYATVEGYHQMGTPKQYNGYTYYFQLSENQLEKTLFEVVGSKTPMDPTFGLQGLTTAIAKYSKEDLKTTVEKGVGKIYPRIEVIIPFSIIPSYFVDQKEDR
jgi:hypothetical protein